MFKTVVYPNIIFNQDYQINEQGEIYSPYRGWHKMKTHKIQKGYLRVHLMTSEGGKFFMVHRLMLEAFSPRKDSLKLQVNHIDGDKENNRFSNLEWCTQSENMAHAARIGLRDNLAKGEKAGCNTLTEEQVIEICEELMNPNRPSYTKIGEKYGVTKYTVHDIKKKKSWAWLTTDYHFE